MSRENFAVGQNSKGEWVHPRDMIGLEPDPLRNPHDDPNYCGESEDGKHVVNPLSLAKADCEDPWIYDVQCKKCGASGAIRVDITKVDW